MPSRNCYVLEQDIHTVMEDTMQLYAKLKQQGKGHKSILGRNREDVIQIENAIPMPVDGLNTKYKSGSGMKINKK